jgi:peptidoglycan/LPS O-acetylase OafA/YrhL
LERTRASGFDGAGRQVDDEHKSASFDGGARPRRSTWTLDVEMIFSLYAKLAMWFRRRFLAVLGVTLATVAVGFGTDRLVGGRTAEVAGRVQFIFLVAYIYLMLIFYIFRPYQGRTGAFLRSVPMQYVAVLVGSATLVLALCMIGFTIHSIAHDDI